MPPAIAAGLTAAAGSLLTGATIGALTVAATAAAVGIGTAALSFISQKLLAPDIPKLTSRSVDREHIIRSAVAPRRVIYGEQLVSGVLVFAATRGKQAAVSGGGQAIIPVVAGSNKNPNEYLHMVIVVAGHEVQSIGQVYFNDRRAEQVSSKYWQVHKHLGGADQEASAELKRAFPNLWTTQHRLRGCAYLHVVLKWDKGDRDTEYTRLAWPSGIPQIRALVKGKKVYDPRSDTSAWSDNWALCVTDFLRNGLGSTSDEIDYDTVIAAANISDEMVAEEKRYTINGTYEMSSAPLQILEAMRNAGAGAVFWTGGEWHVHAGAPVMASRSLNEDDLRGAISFQPNASRRQLFNQVRGTFIDPEQSYQATDFPVIGNSQYVADDGGEKIYFDLDLPFTNSAARAQRLAKIELEYQRQALSARFPATLHLLGIRAWDVVTISIAHLGWDNKKFQVLAWRITEDAGIDLDLKEYTDAVYSFLPTEIRATDPAPNTTLPLPGDVPPIDDLYVSEELSLAGNGLVVAIVLSWGDTSSFVVGYDIEYKLSSASEWTSAGRVFTTKGRIAPVNDGVSYDVRVRSMSILNEPSPWASIRHYYVVGKTAPPEDVAGFLVAVQPDGTREFRWDAVGDTDLAGYRIKARVGIGLGWDDLNPMHEGLLTDSPWETNQLDEGGYTLGIVAVDSSGNESLTPSIITSNIPARRLGDAIFYFNDLAGAAYLIAGTYEESLHAIIGSSHWTNNQWSSYETWDDADYWTQPGSIHVIYNINIGYMTRGKVVVNTKYDGQSIRVTMYDPKNYRGDLEIPDNEVEITPELVFRVVVTPETGQYAQLSGVEIIISGKVQDEFINDADTATWAGSASAGRVVPIIKTFTAITQLQLALQGVSGGYSWVVVSKDVSEPKIKIYDAAGIPTDAIVDVAVKGVA